jgi:CheY-like chemotaxis protein
MPVPVLLCVDDRSESLRLRKTSLEALGYSALSATSTHGAVAMLQSKAVAAVLVEYKLEGMDAEAVAYHIKKRFPGVPIILLSAYSEMPERILWLVDEYVMRSEPAERLSQVIERVTRHGHSPSAEPTAECCLVRRSS